LIFFQRLIRRFLLPSPFIDARAALALRDVDIHAPYRSSLDAAATPCHDAHADERRAQNIPARRPLPFYGCAPASYAMPPAAMYAAYDVT